MQTLNDDLREADQHLPLKVEGLDWSADAQHKLACSLAAQVRKQAAEIRLLAAELAMAGEKERQLLAQDLHDGLAQLLAILKIKISSIKDSERRGRVRGALKDIEGIIDQSNQSVRTLMLHLCPPVLQTRGLIPALQWLAEEMERVYGLAVRVESHGVAIALSEPVKTTLFRAIRELLINVSKHADCQATLVRCLSAADRLEISVIDQGNGFSPENAAPPVVGAFGFGLSSVKDRIELIGGAMHIDSAPGCGTTVRVVYPSANEDQTDQPISEER